MSELQFPKDPIVGQEYDFAPYRYYWDGTKWKTKGIGYNPVNDLRNELEPIISSNELKVSNNEAKVFEALKRSYAEAGLNLVEGSFEEGGQLLVASDVMITASGDGYSWGGPEFPHNVAPGTDPATVTGYVPRTDVVLLEQLAKIDGASIVGCATYAQIRAYTGAAPRINCLGRAHVFDGAHGDFAIDPSDTTSADNDGTILIDAVGRRWKRQFAGDYQWQWWGVTGNGATDDYLAIKKMIDSTGAFCGAAGVFAVSQSLPVREGLRISIADNSGSDAAGLIKPHSSVAIPTAFDFFYANSAQMEHVTISGLRFFGGRHVIRGNFPSGVSSGFISQVNFESCVFQELSGYVIEATNSVFVIDFHRCRLIRCGGVNAGYGVNILKFSQCGFENMSREYIKLDGTGSTLPSASIGMYGCRCEGYDVSPTVSKCFDIKGYDRLFNFEIDDLTYFENVFTDIGYISGVNGLNISNINLTNDDSRVYTLEINDSKGTIGNIESLVGTGITLSGTSEIEQTGHLSGGVSVKTTGSAAFVSDMRWNKSVVVPSVTPIYEFTCIPTGLSGATVFSASCGVLNLSVVSARTSDGTPVYLSKQYAVTIRKMFGGVLAATFDEVGGSGSAGGLTVSITASGASSTSITLNVSLSGSGDYSAGAVMRYYAEMMPVSSSEGPIFISRP